MSEVLPRHVAIVMDGNGRWAKRKHLPRLAGHKAGTDSVRAVIRCCLEKKIPVLSLFAFSSENWQRPEQEVSYLMNLFLSTLEKEVETLNKYSICLKVIGERAKLTPKLQEQIARTEEITKSNNALTLVLAISYGGRWDILEASRSIAREVKEGRLDLNSIDENIFSQHLSMPDLPEPDLFIRTSGEQRISNFFLWQLSYAELYFTDLPWPEFNEAAFNEALVDFAKRKRRFGATDEQLESKEASC